MKTTGLLSFALVTLLAAAACSPKSDRAGESSYAGETAAVSITSAEASALESAADLSGFNGKWIGPEGTSLTITPKGADYQVTVVNLDGPRDFTGKAVADGIAFTRDGAAFTIHKGTGDDTGMKWLAGKHDCLVVTTGEGYCHD